MLGRRELIVGAAGAGALGFFGLQRRPLPPSFDAVNPIALGAKGDGAADDLEILKAAFDQAARSGRPIDGQGALFGVNGSLRLSNLHRPWVRSLRLRQIGPVSGLSTIGFIHCNEVKIDQLEVDLGNDRRSGDMNSTFGLWMYGGQGHSVRNVDAFGHGKNSLIAIWETSNSIYENLVARDAQFDDPAVDDDVMQGIWLYRNSDCLVRSPRAHNLTGNASYDGRRFANLRSRGIAMGGNQRVTIVGPDIRNVDQGIDLTGSDGNRQCVIEGGRTSDCASVGVKFANSAVGCRVSGHVAERCGMYGFMASGPSEQGLKFKTQDCDFVDCTSIDTGYNGIHFSDPSGFIIRRSDYDTDFPKGIRFIRCHAVDRQAVKTMKYGFFSDVAESDRPNRIIDCTSVGHFRAVRAGALS